jgi:hypothetical protein
VRHGASGLVGVAAQTVALQAVAHGPGAAVVPQPHDRSVFTKVR